MRIDRLLAAAALAAAATIASAQTEMRFAHFVPNTHRTAAGVQQWGESLARATGGRVAVRLFPSEQLGKAKDQYDMVRDGIADAAWVVPGYTPGRFPVVSVLELPFAAANADGGSQAFDEWYRQHAAAEMPDVKYCLGFLQDPGVLHTSRKVQGPADLRGLKLRSPTAPFGEFLQLVGAGSISMPAPQVREAVERGTIDGAAFGWQTAVTLGITKAARFHLDAPLYTVPVAYLMNRSFYDRQPKDVQRAIDDHCTPQWARKLGADWAAWESAGRAATAAEPGHQLVTLTPAQVRAWRDSAAPMVDRWQASVGARGLPAAQMLKDLRERLARASAAY